MESALHGGAAVPPVTPFECEQFLANGSIGAVNTKLDQSNVPWRVGVDWKVRPDDLLYATVSRGFKAGSSPILGGASYIQYTPVVQESLLAYEVGAKLSFFDHSLDLDASVFRYDYRNKQVLGRISDPLGLFGAIQALVNIPRSREDGAELQTRWRPLSGLTLSAAATYLQSKVTSDFYNYSQYPTGPTDLIDFKGESFPNAPTWSLNYGASL